LSDTHGRSFTECLLRDRGRGRGLGDEMAELGLDAWVSLQSAERRKLEGRVLIARTTHETGTA